MTINVWKVSTLVLAGALAFTLGAGHIGSASATPSQIQEKQGHMKAARETLITAREQLKKATSDKGGHRVKAIELTNQAIEQVEKGIAFDNQN